MRAAVRNNVAIYPISSAGLTTRLGLADLEGRAALRDVADETGGDAIVGTNNYSGGFRRILDDTSTYYLLGYYPQPEWRDGKFHEIKVTVNRPGLTVRARPGYLAPDPAVTPAPLPSLPADLSPIAAEALRVPAPVRGLAIDAFAAPFQGAAGSASVLVGVHLSGDDLALGAGQELELLYQGLTPDGRLSEGVRRIFTLSLDAATRDTVQRSGLRALGRLELPPGRHQIRIVAHQPGGETGSVLADVEVPDYSKERVALSGVVFASAGLSVDRILAGDDVLRSMLSSDPTTSRRFSTSDTVTAFVEVYTDGGTPADRVPVTAVLAAADGSPLRDVTATRVATAQADAGRAAYTLRLPLAGLAPGTYVLAIEAPAGRRTVSRRVPFTVTAGDPPPSVSQVARVGR
jgi:hypothetical protein